MQVPLPERFQYTLSNNLVKKIIRFEETIEEEKKNIIKKYNPELYKKLYGNSQ